MSKMNEEVKNKDLTEALEESEEIMKHPENYKGYTSVDELFEDLDDEQQTSSSDSIFESSENMEHLKNAIDDLNNGKGVEHELINDNQYIRSIPGLEEDIIAGLKEDITDYVPEDEVEW